MNIINKDFETLHYTEEGRIGFLTITRPDKLNALNPVVIEEMRLLLENICHHKIKGLILTGAGEKSFIAGADIAAMNTLSPKEAEEFAYKGQHVTNMLEELRFPVIAAVNGFALGGGFEMALACDFIFATENAVFGLPEVSLGLIPGFGGTQRLTRVIGRHRAKEMIYTGRKMLAQEAFDMGLCLKLAKDKADLLSVCRATLDAVDKNSFNAVGVAKTVINRGADLNIDEALEIERQSFGAIFNSEDMKEGTSAFIEKRKPNFIK